MNEVSNRQEDDTSQTKEMGEGPKGSIRKIAQWESGDLERKRAL